MDIRESKTAKMSEVLFALILSLAAFTFLSPSLLSLGNIGLMLHSFTAFALPLLLLKYFRPHEFSLSSFALHRSGRWGLAIGILLGLSMWHWNAHWVTPLFHSTEPQQITRLITSRPLWQSLLLFALMPACLEELLHRGYVLPTFVKKFGHWPGILLSALVFGLFHFSLSRLLPTFILGFAAGVLRIKSQSLWPSLLLHFFYNSSLLLAAHWQFQLTWPLSLFTGLLSLLTWIYWGTLKGQKAE